MRKFSFYLSFCVRAVRSEPFVAACSCQFELDFIAPLGARGRAPTIAAATAIYGCAAFAGDLDVNRITHDESIKMAYLICPMSLSIR